MTTGTRLILAVFGHKSDTHSKLIRNFLEALFVNRMPVRHGQHFRVTHIQLMLAKTPLAF